MSFRYVLSKREFSISGIILVALSFVVLLLEGCGDQRQSRSRRQAPPAKVTVSNPLKKDIVEWDEYTGRFAAVDSVEVRARVNGYVQSIHFKEGALISS